MKRKILFLLASAFALPAAAQQPQIQNGKVEVRKDTAIDRAIAGVPAGGPDQAAWVAWKVPMVDGDRDLCSWYSDRSGTVRGTYLDQGVVTVVSDTLVRDRKSTRLNSSHLVISYAVFCLKKKIALQAA